MNSYGNLPITMGNCQICVAKNPPPVYGRHSHDHFELIFLQTGRSLVDLGGHSLIVADSDFIFLPPNAAHFIHANGECTWYQIQLSQNILEQSVPYSFEDTIFSDFFMQSVFTKNSSEPLIGHVEDTLPDIWLLLDSMCLESQKRDLYSDRMLFHLLLTLFYSLLRHSPNMLRTSDKRTKHDHVMIIAKYLLQNYTTASLSGLADQLNYSLSYCSRFVLESTGFRFKELQKKIRMQKAVDFLLHADLPIGTIAEKLGYSSAENFMKVFKQEYGVTPSQYRGIARSQ